MYYVISQDCIKETDRDGFMEKEDTICIVSREDWERKEELRTHFNLVQYKTPVHLCKLESHSEYLYGTIRIPSKKKETADIRFAFYLLEEKIIFIDEGKSVHEQIRKMQEGKLRKGYTLERFLYDFLNSFLEDDLIFLEGIERVISKIEENVLKGTAENFNFQMLDLKKEILRFYRYYNQLTEVARVLMENEIDFFERDEIRTFEMFHDRVGRFTDETENLREYAMQVQDVYQSEIGIRQNNIMKMLTIVTTIFLPLTLIVGWYGMNFRFMPELQSDYGYPAVIIVSILIVIVSLIFFKKRKYW